MRRWLHLLHQANIQTLFVAKSSPWENGYVESFNSRFQQELLDRELFLGTEEAHWCVDRWRLDYNTGSTDRWGTSPRPSSTPAGPRAPTRSVGRRRGLLRLRLCRPLR
ncbi:MAG: integrase core domain-containing protein [Planctomycetota bacterium]